MNIVPMSDIQQMGTAIAKSGLFGMKTPDQAIALMLIAQAEGMHPAIAARDYHVIQGRPALKADAMLARFQAAGGTVQWGVYTDEEVTGTFSHPAGGSITLSWTLAQAKKIGLATKDNWKNYPRAMLRARVISEGIRTVYPGCVVGVYTPEEVQDFAPQRTPAEKDMGVAEVVAEPSGSDQVDAEPASVVELVSVGEQWELKIPGKDSVIYESKEEWITGLLALVDKLAQSKLDHAAKSSKVKDLKELNTAIFRRIGLAEAANIYRDIAKKVPAPEGGQAKKSGEIGEFLEQEGLTNLK
jgi:hypothetical protein